MKYPKVIFDRSVGEFKRCTWSEKKSTWPSYPNTAISSTSPTKPKMAAGHGFWYRILFQLRFENGNVSKVKA